MNNFLNSLFIFSGFGALETFNLLDFNFPSIIKFRIEDKIETANC